MTIQHWAIVTPEGELDQDGCALREADADEDYFDNQTAPPGLEKIRLTYEEFEELSMSYDGEEDIYTKKVDKTVGEGKKTRDLTPGEKDIMKARKPEKYRDLKMEDGRIKHTKADGTEHEKKPDGSIVPWTPGAPPEPLGLQ